MTERSDRNVVIPKGYESQYEAWNLAPAYRVDRTIYCSGQLGFAVDGSLPDDPEEQLTNAFEHMKAVLEGAGASLEDVVKLNSYHVGLQEQLATFVKVRANYFKEPYPAQTAVGVAALAMPGAIVELDATAVLKA